MALAAGRIARTAGALLLALLVLSVLAVLALRWADPWTSAFMLGERVEALLAGEPRRANAYQWRDLEQISPHVALAVVAAEDQRFPFHAGFDLESIRDAMRSNAQSARRRGASTITQQVAKNLFLWRDRSWLRKGLEAWFTVLIEALWPKQRILEVYLNVAEFGPRTYGVEAAARRYWGKSAARLDHLESATLAAVLPNPIRYRVDRPSRRVLARRERIVMQMRALGGATYLRQLDAREPARVRR